MTIGVVTNWCGDATVQVPLKDILDSADPKDVFRYYLDNCRIGELLEHIPMEEIISHYGEEELLYQISEEAIIRHMDP